MKKIENIIEKETNITFSKFLNITKYVDDDFKQSIYDSLINISNNTNDEFKNFYIKQYNIFKDYPIFDMFNITLTEEMTFYINNGILLEKELIKNQLKIKWPQYNWDKFENEFKFYHNEVINFTNFWAKKQGEQ